MNSNDQLLFTTALLVITFGVVNVMTKKARGDDKNLPKKLASECHREEAAKIQSRFGINCDLIPLKDLSIYPIKGGDDTKPALSKAIYSLTKGQDELWKQAEGILKQLIPSIGFFIPHNSVYENDLICNRPVRQPDASDVDYQQKLLSRNKSAKYPRVHQHTWVPTFTDTREARYFDPTVDANCK